MRHGTYIFRIIKISQRIAEFWRLVHVSTLVKSKMNLFTYLRIHIYLKGVLKNLEKLPQKDLLSCLFHNQSISKMDLDSIQQSGNMNMTQWHLFKQIQWRWVRIKAYFLNPTLLCPHFSNFCQLKCQFKGRECPIEKVSWYSVPTVPN